MKSDATFTNDRGERFEATLTITTTAVEIRDIRDGLLLALWTFADLRLVDSPDRGRQRQRLRLTCVQDRNARLTIHSAGRIAALLARLPQEPAGRWGRRLAAWGGGLIVVAAIVLMGWGALSSLDRLIPQSLEESLGEVMARAVISNGRVACVKPAGLAALDRLAWRLFTAGRLKTTPRVLVARDDDVLALPLPGGRIVLSSGLIGEARGPDEIAVVLARGMAHGALRHVTESLRRDLGSWALLGMTFGVAPAKETTRRLLTVAFRPEKEAEADGLALRILRNAGLVMQGTTELPPRFRRKETAEPGVGRGAPASRPGITAPIRPAMSDADWAAVKVICD